MFQRGTTGCVRTGLTDTDEVILLHVVLSLYS